MRALVGIDGLGGCDAALRLLTRLKFPELETLLLHVVESVLPDGSFPDLGVGHAIAGMQQDRMNSGRQALEEARTYLLDQGISADMRLERGAPAGTVLRISDETDADLVAIGCSNKGRWGSLFFGSVSQAIVTGSQRHLLVAKGKIPEDRPLTAVFATDHSAYADKCVDALLQFAPKGIGKIHVLTANEVDTGIAALLVHGLSELTNHAEKWVSEKLLERNAVVATRLSALGAECTPVVREGHPNKVIHQVMEETGADLLIVGAQGHGFLERLTMGSVSFYQVVSERYSVFVLRP